jgi:hypothetical protein
MNYGPIIIDRNGLIMKSQSAQVAAMLHAEDRPKWAVNRVHVRYTCIELHSQFFACRFTLLRVNI